MTSHFKELEQVEAMEKIREILGYQEARGNRRFAFCFLVNGRGELIQLNTCRITLDPDSQTVRVQPDAENLKDVFEYAVNYVENAPKIHVWDYFRTTMASLFYRVLKARGLVDRKVYQQFTGRSVVDDAEYGQTVPADKPDVVCPGCGDDAVIVKARHEIPFNGNDGVIPVYYCTKCGKEWRKDNEPT